ncbi:MAG: HD domain-containing protein [Bacilli bacterium]
MGIDIIKKNMLKNETLVNNFATLNKSAIRIHKQNSSKDIRGEFFRDIDRIIYSLSYTRYADKTQVFSLINNDNISRRFIHVQLVSKIARTIGRSLNLNEDLIEAIALGHDIGHVPFGHAGEKILNTLSQKCLNEYFMHNIQSVRTFMNLEKNGDGNNLTIQVLDGIMCHNGEKLLQKYEPQNKTVTTFLEEYNACYHDITIANQLVSMTLEGCVVRISDVIGYIGKDIEDAVMLGLINRNDIPQDIREVLGNNNRDIVNNIILDIINNSLNKPYIMMSNKIYEKLQKLLKFNYQNIYNRANSEEQLAKYYQMFETLLLKYVNDIQNNNQNSSIYKVFLKDMNSEYQQNNPYRIAIDFIAGMTDDYFINEYENNRS